MTGEMPLGGRGRVDSFPPLGLPAIGLLYWVDAVKGDFWMVNAENAAGFVCIVFEILYSQVWWLVGGFFLGALWRDLPGRHGPTKALFDMLAFAIPATAEVLRWRGTTGRS
ncbi:DUF6185 family protein [Streptomyces chartreusis]|uniref:DUF6185 family protein n=1 Tax=Streptomyces chartreusis TaxID=1969 RepID=UPI003D89EB18